ncbi:hypothetical protein [Comamonas sp. BIGb0124]|uniref:hypothetical protein n=1 Tax=Comamonas sp. BIGb0124 TaxID=2485130 RepID=UPI000F4A2805|nr:hypothetical protein [Comamonas sp. BIGb0124]
MGKHAITLSRFVGAIPILGFFVRTSRMLSRFDRFERQQLPRALAGLSDLGSQQLASTQEVRQLRHEFDVWRQVHALCLSGQANAGTVPASGLRLPEAGPDTAQVVVLRDAAKFAQALRGAVGVSVGLPHDPAQPGTLAVSDNACDPVDIVAPMGAWPFAPGSVACISLGPTVRELYPDQEISLKVLPYLRTLLGQDGLLRVMIPVSETGTAVLASHPWQRLLKGAGFTRIERMPPDGGWLLAWRGVDAVIG